MKLEVGELELLIGPEDPEVDLMYVLDAGKQEEQQDFRDFQCEREK